MSNIDKLKSAAAKAVDNFDPNMFVETRDVLALLDELEAVQKTSAARLGAIDTTHKMFQRERGRAEAAEKRIAELEAMLARLYTECDTGERRGNGSQSGVAMPSWVTVEAARLLLGVK